MWGFFQNWINKLFSEEIKVPKHSLKVERWQGPPLSLFFIKEYSPKLHSVPFKVPKVKVVIMQIGQSQNNVYHNFWYIVILVYVTVMLQLEKWWCSQ